jgi:uncharacterized protein YjbJ (UPF0337 family)
MRGSGSVMAAPSGGAGNPSPLATAETVPHRCLRMLRTIPQGQVTPRPTFFERKERPVSASNKAKGKAEAAKGKIKKVTGKGSGDRVLEGKGKAQQAKGNLKQAGEKVKDAAKK